MAGRLAALAGAIWIVAGRMPAVWGLAPRGSFCRPSKLSVKPLMVIVPSRLCLVVFGATTPEARPSRHRVTLGRSSTRPENRAAEVARILLIQADFGGLDRPKVLEFGFWHISSVVAVRVTAVFEHEADIEQT